MKYVIIYSYWDRKDYSSQQGRLEAQTEKGIQSKLLKAYYDKDFHDILRVSPNLASVDWINDFRNFAENYYKTKRLSKNI